MLKVTELAWTGAGIQTGSTAPSSQAGPQVSFANIDLL